MLSRVGRWLAVVGRVPKRRHSVLFLIMCVGYTGVCLPFDNSPSFLQKFALGCVH